MTETFSPLLTFYAGITHCFAVFSVLLSCLFCQVQELMQRLIDTEEAKIALRLQLDEFAMSIR